MDTKKEEELLALLFVNLKSRKKKTGKLLLKMAQACKLLSEHYGSSKSLAEKQSVSVETIRGFARVAELPEEVKNLIKEEKINFDVAQRLCRLEGKDLQIKVAKIVEGMNADDAREIIQYAKKFPDESLDEIKKRLSASKRRAEKYNLIILPLPEDLFKLLNSFAKKKDISTEKFIIETLRERVNKEVIE